MSGTVRQNSSLHHSPSIPDMSRRPSSSTPRSTSSAASPYPRRTPAQPKSSRQQFSACGACRMRRVRCDLKEFSTAPNGMQPPSCSNCRERSIKCVDEFAEVKAVKLLRRGRRLQQVEAVYGKVSSDDPAAPVVPEDPTSSTFSAAAPVTACGAIPQMQLPFLKSSFFRRFCIQRPILEPSEFASRYVAHMEGTAPLDIEGKILAMLLVIWAASFGIDEFGNENIHSEVPENHDNSDVGANHSNSKQHAGVLRTEPMIKEVLTLVDYHGLLRRPSWDGVRVLLLLLPLTHGILSPIERRATYEATLSQVYSLCSIENPPSVNSGLGQYCDVLIRARIFWYAYVHEGTTTGLDGGRLLLDDDSLDAFQRSLPPRYCASATSSLSPSVDSSRSSPVAGLPVSPTFKSPLEDEQRAALIYLVTSQYFALAMEVAQVCRAIHSTLTGSRARRQIESGVAIRREALVEIWNDLERCWDNFETLRHNPSGIGAAGGDLVRGEDVERFVSGWQVFTFQCFNTVRQALSSFVENSHTTSAGHASMASLHKSAVRWCLKFLPRVINMLQRHIRVPSNFFAHDAGLIRDGCFFAGLLLAQSDKLDVDRDMVGWDADWQEGVMACLQALGEIRWVYSRTQEREKTLKAEWGARIERDTGRWRVQRSPNIPLKESPGHSPCLNDNTPLPCSAAVDTKPRSLSLVSAGGQVRPYLPPLSVSFPHDDSGPDTVLTDDGSGSWEPYTPPPTSGSMTGTVVTHRSLSPLSSPCDSAMIPAHCGIKIFEDDDDMDQLSFTAEGTPDSRTSIVQARWTPFGGYPDPHALPTSDTLGCDNGFSPFAFTRRPYLS